MPTLIDPQILAQFQKVLDSWYVTDYVRWKQITLAWIEDYLPGLTDHDLAKLMYEHVRAGGTIDQVRETRPEWNDRDYHYDFRILVAGRLLYLETVLNDNDPKDPIIEVVSIHYA